MMVKCNPQAGVLQSAALMWGAGGARAGSVQFLVRKDNQESGNISWVVQGVDPTPSIGVWRQCIPVREVALLRVGNFSVNGVLQVFGTGEG